MIIFQACKKLEYLKIIRQTNDSVTGTLVQWLWQQTHVVKVMSSNPNTIYWMKFLTLICFQICNVCLEKTENKRKRGRGWPIFELYSNKAQLFVGQIPSTEFLHVQILTDEPSPVRLALLYYFIVLCNETSFGEISFYEIY